VSTSGLALGDKLALLEMKYLVSLYSLNPATHKPNNNHDMAFKAYRPFWLRKKYV
jgi:hypothetical protein